MQYFSSSTIRCSPRAWPSIRRSRLRWAWTLVVALEVSVLLAHASTIPLGGIPFKAVWVPSG